MVRFASVTAIILPFWTREKVMLVVLQTKIAHLFFVHQVPHVSTMRVLKIGTIDEKVSLLLACGTFFGELNLALVTSRHVAGPSLQVLDLSRIVSSKGSGGTILTLGSIHSVVRLLRDFFRTGSVWFEEGFPP